MSTLRDLLRALTEEVDFDNYEYSVYLEGEEPFLCIEKHQWNNHVFGWLDGPDEWVWRIEFGEAQPEMEPFMALCVYAAEHWRELAEQRIEGATTVPEYIEYCKDHLRGFSKSATKQ
jgi:hypothetical protein